MHAGPENAQPAHAARMRAVVCSADGIHNLELREVDAPPMAPGSVRIAVHACGVAFANLLVVEGKHQNKFAHPFTPGTEVAGTVLECGPSTTLFKPGDRVVAGVRTGGYAQQVVVPEATVFKLPDAVDYTAAVQFPTIYATAYGALKWRANIQPGEVLLVNGAAGGSGLAAIELGKQFGAVVIAAAGSAAKLDAARAHGADHAINYRDGSFKDAVLALTAGRGVDVVFDPVGGNAFDEALRCTAPDGRVITMGFAGGAIPQIPANVLLVKNITVIGIYWGYYLGWGRLPPLPGTAERVRQAFAELLGWAAEGKLKPETYGAFPLADFRDALAAVSGREVIGRVALLPRQAA